MSIFTQVAIGILPVFILFLVFAIVRKEHRIRNIAMSAFFVAFIAAAVAFNFLYTPPTERIAEEDASEQLKFIYAVAGTEGGMEQARELLLSLRENSTDSVKTTLCDAYLRAASGDARAAKVLFGKAVALDKSYKNDKFITLCDAAIKEGVSALSSGKASDSAVEKLREYAIDQMSDETSDSGYDEAAEALVEAEELFDGYISGNELDREKVEDLVDCIDSEMEKKAVLSLIPQLRVCRMKLLVLNGDYKEIANNINEDSGFDEVAVASELYINDMIGESDFSDEYASDYKLVYKAVSEQLTKVQDKIPDDNPIDKKGAKVLLEQLKGASKKPALYRLKDELSKTALDESSPDRPKAYMQLSRVEYETGDADRAEEYISSSLSTVGMSDDDDFSVPLTNIVDVITDKDDPEKLKNVAEYVNDVTNHTSDEVVIKAIKTSQESEVLSPPEESGETGEKESYDTFMTDYVSRKRVTIDITAIDASEFETVKATVNVDDSISLTAEELKGLITVKDCGVEITDFTVEKVEYEAANILLCCDVSGSMSGDPIEDLKDAVVLFVDTAEDIENIALVSFSGAVEESYDFGTSNSKIISAAESFSATGGTNMYDALISSIGMFEREDGELNTILLLSDGEDGVKHSTEEIYENIGKPAKEKGIIIYSLGLGSAVNTDYMNALATSAGGSFLYVSDSATLDSFYEHLRNQILNQYIITFNAEDTLSVDRELVVHLTDDPVSRDVEQYSLSDDEGDEGDEPSAKHISLQNKGIYGLDTRLIYKSSKSTEVTLRGFGFEEDDKISIELDGDLDYGDGKIVGEYIDGNNIKVTLPGGIACGEYDVRVSINGKTAILVKELTVVEQGSEKKTEFGPYVFTSYTKAEGDNKVTLSNNVMLNGWLNFSGDVVLTGNLGEYSIDMTDLYGSYVKYYTGSASGFAEYLASKGKAFPIAPLGTIKLHNDPSKDPQSADYPVTAAPVPILSVPDLFTMNAAGVSLYPDRIELKSDAFTTKFPMQDKILKGGDLFNFEASVTGVITNKEMGLRAKVSNKPEKNVYSPVNLGAMPIYVSPAKFTIDIDTLANKYELDLGTQLAFLKGDGIGLSAKWSIDEFDGLKTFVPSELMVKADVKVNSTIGPVPVTYRKFELGMKDIDPEKNILDWTLVGKMDVEISKLTELLPTMEGVVGDMSLATLDDATLEFSFGQKYISIGAKLTVLKDIQLAEAKIEAGKLSYTSVMLGMNNVEAAGLYAQLSAGIKWNSDNCKVNIGGTSMLSAHSKFFGLEAVGTCDVDVKWWILEAGIYKEGRGIVGMYVDEYGVMNFIIKARDISGTKGSKEYYLCWNENVGLDYGRVKL